MKRTPMTLRGAERLRQELKQLKSEARPNIIKAIAEARAHGDLSENAEYHAAREQQSFIEGRINDIENRLSNAEVIDVTKLTASGRVVFGSTVQLEDQDGSGQVVYQLVGDDEADIKQGLLSVSSPIARALIGKSEGDVVDVTTPGGTRTYEIVSVTLRMTARSVTAVRNAFRVLCVLWAGSLWALAAWVAPTLFGCRATAHLAGLLAGRLFGIETCARPGGGRDLRCSCRAGADSPWVYAAAALLAINEWGLKPLMAGGSARAAPPPVSPSGPGMASRRCCTCSRASRWCYWSGRRIFARVGDCGGRRRRRGRRAAPIQRWCAAPIPPKPHCGPRVPRCVRSL